MYERFSLVVNPSSELGRPLVVNEKIGYGLRSSSSHYLRLFGQREELWLGRIKAYGITYVAEHETGLQNVGLACLWQAVHLCSLPVPVIYFS